MNPENNTTNVTAVAKIKKISNKIFHLELIGDAYSVDECKKHFEILKNEMQSEKAIFMYTFLKPPSKSLTAETRRVNDQNLNEVTDFMAIVVENPMVRIFAKFFAKLSKWTFQYKFFASEPLAMTFLENEFQNSQQEIPA